MINFRNENWKCEKARSIIVNDEYDIINENGDLIATVYPISNNDGDTAKIARLFAIAPAMYLLLQQIALENFSDKYTSQTLALISFVNKD